MRDHYKIGEMSRELRCPAQILTVSNQGGSGLSQREENRVCAQYLFCLEIVPIGPREEELDTVQARFRIINILLPSTFLPFFSLFLLSAHTAP